MSWIRHGFARDAGDFAGDVQVGGSAAVWFVNPELPGRLVTVYMCPVAPELDLDDQPECGHRAELLEDFGNGVGRFAPLPAEHWRCTHKMDAAGVQMVTEFMICDDVDDPGSTEKWSIYAYQSRETPPFPGTVEEIIKAAEAKAVALAEGFDANLSIHWDGERF